MEKKLVHVGIAVNNLKESIPAFSRLFGSLKHEIEEVTDQGVRVAFFQAGQCSIEITEPTSEKSPIRKFIDKRGEGVHHLSFEVDNLKAELDRLRAEGFQLIDQTPRRGAGGYLIAFVHPKSTCGVLIELCQKVE